MNLTKFLCDKMCISESEVISFSLTSPHRYKVYEIPKRNSNKTRTIAHPAKELKFIQKLIVSYLENKLPVHNCAYAYKLGIGIKNNAQVHLKTKYFLKMDFESFFPSITPALFFDIAKKTGLEISTEDNILLQNFLFWKEKRNSSLKLSIGAPSSPLVSNFIMYYFDENIKIICEQKDINYTRYADDLAFSTNKKNTLFEIPNIVINALEAETQGIIKVNPDKTIFSSKAHNRHITGITLTNDNKLSIGRERKRLISSMIHKFSQGLLDIDSILKLQGLMSFANHIEEDFYHRMSKKYGKDILIEILKIKRV